MTMFFIWAIIGLGCVPDCEKTCTKLLDCESVDTPMLSLQECASACAAQEDVYQGWDDTQKQAAFDDLKSCIVDSECSEISDGVCYDDELYIW